ncbi:PHD finger domain-containing protein [Didymella exigua CBS 183.55]|uniref:PHD finger domain-containing protein n=1 Tax=Didymella exigua CBS 183.55 TaxID=1150837 RepID=A0A6A5RV15_9PLEO|nr:PHD finger domain-containing protein [Didymella exigua CBS 183.55]KAF1930136.1 PHD finger domain-containing protein [Didymella exigua CBS 183.55]
MPPTTGTRTSTRQGRATVRPTNYYARGFAGRLAAHGLEQTPEASNSAPGFFPALTHFTGAVDAFPKEVIKHFSMFKEVEAKLHDPELLLEELLNEIARQPITTNAQRRAVEQNDDDAVQNANQPPTDFASLSPAEQALVRKRQLFLRLRMLIQTILPTLDEKLVVLQGAKATKEKGLTRMTHSYSQLDAEISEEARYGSLTHWAYADKEEKKKGAPNHERQRREVAAANNLAAAAQHVHDVDSIAAKSEARREAILAKRSRQQQADSDFDDRPAAKKPQKRKAHAPDTSAADHRAVGLGISGNVSGQSKRKKTEKALTAAAPSSAPMERSISGALKAVNNTARAGSSPRATPSIENGANAKRKPRTAPAPTPRKNQQPTYSPPPASSPLAANFAINKAIAGAADRPLSSRARKNSIAKSAASGSAPEPAPVRRPSTSHSVQQAPSSNAITELEQAAGIVRDHESAQGASTAQDTTEGPVYLLPTVLKQEDQEHIQKVPECMDIDTPAAISSAARAARASKPGTPVVGSFPEIPMARSRSTRNAQNGNSNSNGSSETNSTVAGAVSKRSNKKSGPSITSAVDSPAPKPTPAAQSNPPSSATSSVAPEQEYQDAETDEGDDEPRYCYCNEVSYGQMVACDNDACPREWFHLPCVQLEKAPVGRTKWFCSDECQEQHAKAKAKGKRPGSSRQ